MKIISLSSNKNTIREALEDYIEKVDKNWNYITPTELKKQGTKNFFIIDLREEKEYKKGHIPGAINIFWKDLLKQENLDKLPENKKILLVCYVGHTSSQMLVALSLLGYDVISLKFGMGISPVEGVPVAGWLDYGFELEK